MQTNTFSQKKQAQPCYIYIHAGQVLVNEHFLWLHKQHYGFMQAAYQSEVIRVVDNVDISLYLYIIDESAIKVATLAGLKAISGRELLSHLDAQQGQWLSRALQLSHWVRNHQFCGRCGNATVLSGQETMLHCDTCKLSQYPRISPCIIVAIIGPKGLLLAHNANYPPGRYSTLAGFVEAGESVEQALHREVYEEVGVQVSDLQYMGSQSWGFPHSLMLGFLASYKEGDIRVDGKEITAANWFTQDNLPDLPPVYSISRQLINQALSKLS